MTLNFFQLIEYYVRKIFMGKSCRNYSPKASPRPLLNFGKQPKTASSIFLGGIEPE